jgi:hypothetical protein
MNQAQLLTEIARLCILLDPVKIAEDDVTRDALDAIATATVKLINLVDRINREALDHLQKDIEATPAVSLGQGEYRRDWPGRKDHAGKRPA